MNPICAIVNAFRELRNRGVVDPLYVRLVLKASSRKGDVAKGWLWRYPDKIDQPLDVGESFILTVVREFPNRAPLTVEVEITWRPNLFAQISGTDQDRRLVLWFLHQDPRVSGGTHQSVDQFRYGAADWNLKTGDFFLVRCGHYRNGDGVLTPRQPSVDALDWVQDPRRFLTAEFVRARVLRAMSGPLPTGEFLTIRRVFNGHRAVAV